MTCVSPGTRRVTWSAGSGQGGDRVNIGEDRFPPGIYRLVGHVHIGEDTGYYKTNTFEKPEG